MHAGHDVPDLFFARIRRAGGPYRVDDAIAIAYCAPTVGRLVASEAAVRERCAQYERSSVPEIVSAIVEHAVAPYAAGETLTLYFVDPAIARIGRDAPQSQLDAGRAEILRVTQRPERMDGFGMGDVERDKVSYRSEDLRQSTQTREGEPMTLRDDDRMRDERDVEEPTANGRAANERTPYASPAEELGAKERVGEDRTVNAPVAIERTANETELFDEEPATASTADAQAGIIVRLEWSPERVRRFITVVDRLFTIDRLGWYRHSLAMRLLIPDEIRSGDELADVEAMRHLHALRSAAVAALGKPLLAACMPGFAVTSEWLDTLESSREARAIAGLRDALLPYARDGAEDTNRLHDVDAAFTVGTVGKRALLAENATSVESFLPILIPTEAHDPVLRSRLMDYRSLLVELFAQTARATDPVRLGTLTQPNHSLDDRLWQLVGAVGEAFGGFVHT